MVLVVQPALVTGDPPPAADGSLTIMLFLHAQSCRRRPPPNPGPSPGRWLAAAVGVASLAVAADVADSATAPNGLATGLAAYLRFDGSLEALNPAGIRAQATFRRGDPAHDESLRPLPANQPRYADGRFGAGILIEYGRCASGPQSGRNVLPDGIAAIDEAVSEQFVAVGEAELERRAGPSGHWALAVEAKAPASGLATRPMRAPRLPEQVFSLYATGEAGLEVEVRIAIEGAAVPLASSVLALTGDWRQAAVAFRFDTDGDAWGQAGERTPPLVFSVVARQAGHFQVAAPMLEPSQGYAGRRGPTTWVAPGRSREGEILQAGRLDADDGAGSIAFWAQTRGRMDWRTLLTLGDGAGWQVPLRLDLRSDQRLELQMTNAKRSARAALPDPFAWHHYALTWDGPTVVFYLDGQSVAELADTPGLANAGAITIGGVATNFSPALRADAVFDEYARWNRALEAGEVARLAALHEPLGALFEVGVALEDLAPVKVFARDLSDYAWPLVLANRTAQPLAGLTLRYGVPGLFARQQSLATIPAGGELPVAVPFGPAWLMPGDYAMQFVVDDRAGLRLEYVAPFAVVPARLPLDNAQIVSWGGHSQAMADAGVTVGGIAGGLHGPPPHEVEQATRRGLYTQLRLGLSAGGARPDDHFIDAAGQQRRPDQSTPAAQASLERQVERLASTLERLPDVTHAILNCEQQWIWHVDFRETTVALVRQRFGLDLERWRAAPVANADRIQHPFGRLQPAVAGIVAPADGIIAANDSFYAFSRWWQSGEPGNEVFLNDLIARRLRQRVPRVQTIAEPALRRPAVRAFRDQGILNEWFYYPTPRRAIWIQEELATAARGTQARIAGMPQFLFKPNMAAPYGGMPTPTLFREAVWHCLTRPSLGLTYWNLWSALERGGAAHVKTREEIDELLGPTPTWAEAAAKIERRGEWTSVFLWIPELADEIHRLHHELVHPLGGLWPRWRNAPRRIAVYKSFAGQLFNGIRWPGPGALGEAVATAGLPFDLLYDQDFEEFPDGLDSYAVVAIPEAPAITASAAAALRAFGERGGIVVVDQHFRAELPGSVRLDFSDRGDLEALRRAERELLAEYGDASHVLFIEGMEEARRQFAASGGPVAQVAALLREHASGEIGLDSSTVSLNLLEAGQARYLTAVNSLAEPCAWYGHFGRVRGQGVAQTAELSLAAGLGEVAYRLDTQERLEMATDAGGRRRLRLPLEAGGGAVVMLLPAPIAGVVAPPPAAPVERGQSIALAASLISADGKPVPGLVPARIDLVGPDGKPLDGSRYDVFVDGRWALTLPVAFNQPVGVYGLTVTELASGLAARQTWSVE